MKKILLFIFSILSLNVNAQVLDFSNIVNAQKLSDDFLQKLEKCTPYLETKKWEVNGLENILTYEIIGKKNVLEDNTDQDDLICELKIYSKSNNNVSSSSICSFDDLDLQMYVQALKKYNERTSYTLDNLPDVLSDENYIMATAIVMTNCKAVREKIDNTENIRKNLISCNPYEETEKQGSVEITRKILGLNNNNCEFQYVVLQKKPDLKNISGDLAENLKELMAKHPISDKIYTYNCSFSEGKKQELLKILESMIIPEGDAMDFSYLENLNPQLEMEFLSNNCEAIFDHSL